MAQARVINAGTFILSFGFGLSVGVAELFFLRTRLRELPFLTHLAVKSLAITVVIYVAAAVLNVLDVIIEGITWRAYAECIRVFFLIEDQIHAHRERFQAEYIFVTETYEGKRVQKFVYRGMGPAPSGSLGVVRPD